MLIDWLLIATAGTLGLYGLAHGTCIVHELAHVAVAKLRGVPVNHVEFGRGESGLALSWAGTMYVIYLWPVSGETKLDESNARDLDLLLIGMAGPASNLILGGILLSLSPIPPWGGIAGIFNVALGVATLIGPSWHSDGGRILKIFKDRWK